MDSGRLFQVEMSSEHMTVDAGTVWNPSVIPAQGDYEQLLLLLIGRYVYAEDRALLLDKLSLSSLGDLTAEDGIITIGCRMLKWGSSTPLSYVLQVQRQEDTVLVDSLHVHEPGGALTVFQRTHDPLTGLLLRSPARAEIQRCLDSTSAPKGFMALIDLDNMGQVNDKYGYLLGNELLIRVGELLEEIFPKDAVICRYSGDDFQVFFLSDIHREQVKRLLDSLRASCQQLRHSLCPDVAFGVSIGAAMTYPEDWDVSVLEQRADVALYRSKIGGKNRCGFYDSENTPAQTPSAIHAEEQHFAESRRRERSKRPGRLPTWEQCRPVALWAAGVLVCLFILVGLGYCFFWNLWSAVQAETMQNLGEISVQINSGIQSFLSDRKNHLVLMAEELNHNRIADKDAFTQYLSAEAAGWGYQKLGAVDQNGGWLMSDGMQVDLGGESTVGDIAQSKEQLLTTAFSTDGGGFFLLTPMEPLTVSGKQYVALGAYLDEAYLREKVPLTSFSGQGYNYVLERSGRVLFRSNTLSAMEKPIFLPDLGDSLQFGKSHSLERILGDMAQGKTGSTPYRLEGEDKYLYYTPIPSTEWYLLTVVPVDVVNMESEGYLRLTVVAVALVTGFFLLSACAFLLFQLHQKRHLRQIAYSDTVTGWTNRRKLEMDIPRLMRRDNRYVVVYSNVERFRTINDLVGRSGGDLVLKSVCDSFRNNIFPDEAVGRLVADDFGLLLHRDTTEHLEARLFRMQRDANDAVETQVSVGQLFFTFGIYFPQHASENPSEMLDSAEIARDKSTGENERDAVRVGYYSEMIRSQLLQEKLLEDKLQPALLNHDFVVYLQPKYRLSDNKLVGAEALVRWLDSELGMLYPGQFIPVFEKSRRILQLDLYVFEEVCSLLRWWLDNGFEPVRVSVNMSRQHLRSGLFLQPYKKLMEQYMVPGRFIEFEFTETLASGNMDVLAQNIQEIHDIGCVCSMDDFGSGYSSLNMLKEVDVDILKLDRGFFQTGEHDNPERTWQVVNGVLMLAHTMGLETVAEGVETMEQVQALKERGCDLVQGYVFAKPMPVAQFEQRMMAEADKVSNNAE